MPDERSRRQPMNGRYRTLGFVVATKDRPDDLRRLLESLALQTTPVSEVVIVDASAEPVERLVQEFPTVNVRYIRFEGPPSAAKQRNAGVAAADKGIELLGFADDDATFDADAVSAMLDYWNRSPEELGGASFNIMNPVAVGGKWLKRSRFAERLGLYCPKVGQVAPSGWQTVMETVGETCYTEWLSTTAVVWRRDILQGHRFDDYFAGYSYLEDLDFSYGVGKSHKLAIVADARYEHHHSAGGRMSQYRFGRMEVTNRLHFVRKHGLSVSCCYAAIAVRFLMTLGSALRSNCIAHCQRALGNVAELTRSLLPGSRRRAEKTTR